MLQPDGEMQKPMEFRRQAIGAKSLNEGCQKGVDASEKELWSDKPTEHGGKAIDEVTQSHVGCHLFATNREENDPQCNHSVQRQSLAGLTLEFLCLVI